MKNISFDNPYLLLIFLALAVFIIVPFAIAIRKENKSKSAVASLILHIIIAICVALACAGMHTSTVMTETQVYIVADVSYSSAKNLDVIDSYISEIENRVPENSKIGVVCFGRDFVLNTPIGEDITSVKGAEIDTSATDISSALDYTSTLFDPDVIKRIVLITDGNETVPNSSIGKLISSVENLYEQNIYIDSIYLDNNLSENQKEIQVSGVNYTASTYLNHESIAEVLIQSNQDSQALAVLSANGEKLESRALTLKKGYNIISFPLDTSLEGIYDYKITVVADDDRTAQNNAYSFTQSVAGKLSVLLVSELDEDLERATALYGANATIDAYINDKNVPCSVEDLCKYDEIILSNVDVRKLNNFTAFIDGIDKAVSVFGKSLVTMGDLCIQNKTDEVLKQLEDMLPVIYGNNDQEPQLYTILLDTSRSMQNFGRLPIAKEAAYYLIDMLSENDYVCIIHFWGKFNIIQTPTQLTDKEAVKELIRKIDPYQGTLMGNAMKKAKEELTSWQFEKKQVMLISDGLSYSIENDDPIEQTAELFDLGITTSVIHPAAREEGEATLRAIAAAGGGGYYEIAVMDDLEEVMFSEIADELTETVITDQCSVNIDRNLDEHLEGVTNIPDIRGIIYTKKKGSAVQILSANYKKSEKAVKELPLYTYWSYGNGKVSTLSTSPSGEWTKEWQGNDGEVFLSNISKANTPAEHIDYPFTLHVNTDGNFANIEIVPAVLNPYATAEVIITTPDFDQINQQLAFDSSKYAYKFETPMTGRYQIEVIYSYADASYSATSAFNISYVSEYNNFYAFNPAQLHAAIRNRGTVNEGVVPTLENNEDEIALYTVRFTVPLMILAVVLYVIDIAVRKIKKEDIKGLFKKKTKIGEVK